MRKKMEKIKAYIKEKNLLPKFAFCIIFILIYAFLLAFKNVPYIEFVVTEDERVLKEGSKLKINYNVDEDIQHITALYKESIFNHEGIVLDNVEVIGEYDKNALGEYPVTLRAEYDGFVDEVEVIVWVRDLMRPVITLEGERFMTLAAGEPYVEPGFTAVDNFDGDITDQVEIRGTVRPNGRTYLEYEVTDSNGNTRVVKRRIDVKIGEEQKVIYLTFDDGPNQYTERLLNVLDEYNAKATFFVIGGNDKYYDLIGDAYDRGHTIAVHSFSHDYSEIYDSTEAFFDDLKEIEKLVYEQTGVRPTIMRFPGGTSNQVGDDAQEGIMSELVNMLPEYGYTHCDWNVSSGDGAANKEEETIVNAVIAGVQKLGKKESAVVLMHDSKKTSVDAVDDILEWGLENGYVFLPLIDGSPMPQHEPQN